MIQASSKATFKGGCGDFLDAHFFWFCRVFYYNIWLIGFFVGFVCLLVCLLGFEGFGWLHRVFVVVSTMVLWF